MSVIDQHRLPLEERLRNERTIWLSSIRPDGRPHVVPVWFTWDVRVVDLFSKPSAQKVRNLRERPDVMMAVGEPDEDFDVELVEGTADVLARETAEVIESRMFEKYADLMTRAGVDSETYVRTYSQPVRITPTRVLGYGGKGWLEPHGTSAPGPESDVSAHVHLSIGTRRATASQREAVAAILRAARRLHGRSPVLRALDE